MGKRADTIERIKQNARELFWAEGYKKVTMQEIADRSGITKGLLTHYFPQKKDIVSSINYQDFISIYNFADTLTGGDAFLNYLIALYTVRKAFTTQPQLRHISEEAYTKRGGEEDEVSSHKHDDLYLEIVRQFNINMDMEDIYPKVIMARGAALALAKYYYEDESRMELEEYIKQAVLVTGTMFEIPYITRNQYYDRLLEIVNSRKLPGFDYLHNNFV